MLSIRYVRSEVTAPNERNMLTASHPFPKPTAKYYTEYIHISLPNGVFVCGHERAHPGYTLKTKAKGLYLHFIISGKGSYNDLPFRKNDMFVIYPGSRKDTESSLDDPWELYWCVWKGEVAKEIQNRLSLKSDCIYRLKTGTDFVKLFQYLIYSEHRLSKIDKLAKSFSELLIADLRVGENPEKPEDPYAPLVAEIQKYIAAHLADVTVEKLAQQFAYDRKYLTTNIFRRVTGMSLKDYIQDTRLGYAESYLLSTSLPIGEVALRAGYSGYSSFVKAFKHKYGVTPSAFIRMNRV